VCSNEVDVILLQKISSTCDCPFDHSQKFPFENVELSYRDTADFCVESVVAKDITKAFAGDCNGGDEESMAGE